MRRSMFAAVLALAVLAWPAHAQLFGSTPSADQGAIERVVFDALLMLIPPFENAPCMQLEAGQLTVRLKNLDVSGGSRPTTFRFQGYRGGDSGVHIETSVGTTETATTTTLAGARYCWSFEIYAPVTMQDGMALRTNYTQGVALRMTLAPAQ